MTYDRNAASTLLTALAFARHGHAVFPLWWPVTHNGQTVCACGRLCGKQGGKHPHSRFAPNGIHSATLDSGIIKLLFGLRCPEANLGVSTEKLVVIDADPRHGGDEALAALEHEHEMPRTWRSQTGGGGAHVIFAAPDNVAIASFAANTMSNPPLGSGVDVRAKNGYIVSPPSRHISGGEYSWRAGFHPADTPLAVAPPWLIERLTARGTANNPDDIPEPLPSDVWWRLTHQPVEEYRDREAVRIAGHLFAHWCDYQLVLGLLHCWNTEWCKPPLGYLELKRIVDRIATRQANKRSWQ